MPIVYQGERFAGEGSEWGTGNTTYQGFFTPAKPGKLIWGVGPSVVLPTSTELRFGPDKWSLGANAVVLTMPGHWVIGGLVSQVWSVGGRDSDPSVSEFTFQYFINYNMAKGWYLSTTPVITANWQADSDDTWTVPFGGGVGRVFKIGKQPVNAKVEAFYNVERPNGAPDWVLQASFTFLFPEKK